MYAYMCVCVHMCECAVLFSFKVTVYEVKNAVIFQLIMLNSYPNRIKQL